MHGWVEAALAHAEEELTEHRALVEFQAVDHLAQWNAELSLPRRRWLTGILRNNRANVHDIDVHWHS